MTTNTLLLLILGILVVVHFSKIVQFVGRGTRWTIGWVLNLALAAILGGWAESAAPGYGWPCAGGVLLLAFTLRTLRVVGRRMLRRGQVPQGLAIASGFLLLALNVLFLAGLGRGVYLAWTWYHPASPTVARTFPSGYPALSPSEFRGAYAEAERERQSGPSAPLSPEVEALRRRVRELGRE